jgi:capsular exopolysaccharide synthesis family protein
VEQLEKALAKAREQRAAKLAPTAGDQGQGRAAATNRGLSISYQRTHVFSTPREGLVRNRIVANDPGDERAEVYRVLRTRVLNHLTRAGKSTLGVTSAQSGEGKTVTAVNLAIAIAMDVNQTVLLVDADLRAPSVHRCFGVEPTVGLADYLLGQAEIADCFLNPGMDRIVLLPTRGNVSGSAELLASPQMARLAQELKQRYPDRVIIYDLPPLLTTGDTIGFLSNLDSVLLVVRDGAVRASDMKRTMELLAGQDLVGTVLNDADRPVDGAVGYGYYFGGRGG